MPIFIKKDVAKDIANKIIELGYRDAMIAHAKKRSEKVIVPGLGYSIINQRRFDLLDEDNLAHLIYYSQFGNSGPMYALNIAAIFDRVKDDFSEYKEAMAKYVDYVNKSARELYSNAPVLTLSFY